MIKLIAIDLDGTLLNSDMEISKENQNALTYAKDKGVHVAIATGRPYVFTKVYMEILGLDTYIMYNGGQILYQGKELIPSVYLDQSIIMKTIDIIDMFSSSYMLHGQDTVYFTPSKRVHYLQQMSERITPELRANFEQIVDPLPIITTHQFNKVLIVEHDIEKHQEMYEYIVEHLDNVEVTKSSSFYIEVLPKGITKGKAVRQLADTLKIKQDEIMTIGDQENDLSMISFAGVGVAMGNATDVVKNAADYVTFTNNENGVSHAIKRFL